ncbi:type II CRISPR-associated endonuclease Cas1 [Tenacibaculum sp. 1_MG-2023]|uniref:type II CRISPR-associated endonuclease Cas1 n=1 Tax=Tenacibaculum sp. 1_MG-2023 TaxID=3062653 RepID=UPI0026E20E8B|nr:type II CRISPR-associated endonuclease Cas1 [Tenacibaculum sp. 1_MG-2023]MDO6674675.1 type II CRISPR-associated endonuclease Cas1 [Tenacibaculum sp. 1_MG-2023]
MLKRTIYIGNPTYLKLKHHQLVVECPETKDVKGTIPIEDIALLLLDHYQITLSTQLINYLMGNGVALIHCDNHHLPNGLMLPLVGHSELTERWRHQLNSSVPLKKQLWKQTVIAKIENQKQLLQHNSSPVEAMQTYLEKVTSGDETNMEGKAANHYWKYILTDFQRERFGDAPNNYLNFGYAVLRSIVARAIVSSGMLPAQGIFHKNKYNPYCLADDIMEPYRPFIDKLVLEYITKYPFEEELSKQAKAYLLQVATEDVLIDEKKRPLMVAVTTTTASLYKCFTGERRTILYPKLL